MIDADDQPTTPPSSPPPPPPIAPAPTPLGLGRRLLGSIRALSSAIALPSPPPASEPKLGLSLLLHLKPDYQDPPPPPASASASYQDKDQEDPVLDDDDGPQAAPTRTSKRALHPLLLLQPTPTACSSHHAAAAAAVENHPGGLVDQPCAGHGSESDPTKEGLEEQDKVTNQGTLLVEDDAAAARDDHRDDFLQHQHRTTAHHQLKVDATTHPSPRDAAQEQHPTPEMGLTDNEDAVPDQEVVGQGVVAAGMGQGTVDTAVDDDLDKPVHQCASCEELGIADNNDAEHGLEAVEQGVIDQGAAPMDDNAVNAHEEVGQSVIDAIAVDNDQDKAVEQCATCDDLGTRTMENADAVQLQKAVEQQDATQPRGDIAAEEQEFLEQGHTTHDELGTTMGNADAVQVQEALEQGVVATNGESADATAVDDHDKAAVEQCATYDDFGTTMENDGAKDDQEEVEQGVIDQGDAAMDDNAVKDHEALLLLSAVEGTCATTDDIAVEDQEKNVDQCTTYDDLGTTIENCDVVDGQQVVEQGVVDLTMDNDDYVEEQKVVMQNVVDLTMDNDDSVKEHKVVEEGVVDLTMDDDDPVEDHKVLEQSIIDGTDDIAVEEQEKVLERCSRATKDEYTVKEKDMVVEQGVLEPTYVDLATKDHDKLTKQGTIAVPMDDIVVKEDDKAVVQYASDAIVTIKDESPVEEHDTVGNQGVIDRNDRTKDDIDVEGHGYVKEQVIIDNWGTSSDATALEDQKNGAELCIGDEHIAGKDMDGVHAEGNLSEQSTGDKQGATQSDFTVKEHKDVVERVCNEWGAPEDDRAMDDAAYQGTREISSSEVVSGMVNGSYGGMVKKEKVYQPVRYPQKPRKLNCPFYMTKGTCSYGPSCHFNHPQQHKAKTNDSWRPSEQGNHGVTEILELNRLGLPIREGARNCVYYMRNGACGYGKNCHFNHPDHVIDAQFNPRTGWEDNALQTEKSSDHTLDKTSRMKKPSDDATIDDRSHLKKSSDGATVDDTSYSKKSSDHDKSYSKKSSDHDISYSKKSSDHDTSSSSGVLPPNILRMLLPPQKVLSSTEGKAKKNSDWSSASDGSDGCCSADSSDGPLCKQEEHADYPERPGRPECPFYERYGDCKFASACKYHHSKQSKDKEEVNYPERPGRADCPFYMRFGDCKFASACNYHHPKDKDPERPVPQQAQYPERPGQPDCRYYLQFGKCKYLSACIFHHPKDRLAAGWNPSDPAHSDQTGPECPFYMKAGKCQFGSACEFLHPKDIHSTTEEAFGQRTGSGSYDNSTRSENGVEQQKETRYPERPGEPECSHYMRQGYCKFQMNCKYHHPADRLSKKPYDSTYR